MSKNLNHNKRFTLEDKDETRWLFFLSSSNRILYCKLEEENESPNNVVDSQPVKDFYATIDENGTIRILAYTFSRMLIYYEWLDNRWKRQVLERIYSRFQNISYISILSSSNNIHILYYIESSLMKSAEFLVHYYLQGGKWYGGRLWKFISDDTTVPRTVFIDPKDSIHIIFTKRDKDEGSALFHARFHSGSLSWTEPTFIHICTKRCEHFQLYVDGNENNHLVWIENIDNTYQLKHLYQISNDPVTSWNETILYQSKHNISSPTLVQGDKLLCIWEENNVLYQVTSLNSGKTWSQPYPITKNTDEQFSLLHFISYNRNKIPSHSIGVWTQGYPDIKLAGIGRSEIKTADSPKQPLQPDYSSKFAEIKSAISSINKEVNQANKEVKRNKTQISNLSSQIDELYSAVYELQEQLRLKEKSIFAIQTEIKRLGFEIRRMYRQPKSVPNINTTNTTKNAASEPDKTHPELDKGRPKLDKTDKTDKKTDKEELDKSTENEAKDKELPKENKETEKITLGNTTILINPEDSDI